MLSIVRLDVDRVASAYDDAYMLLLPGYLKMIANTLERMNVVLVALVAV